MSAIRREVIIGDCRLLLGDCLEVLPILDADTAIVCDPPYGMAWDTDSRRYSGGRSDLIRRHKQRGPGRKHAKVVGDDRPFDPAPLLRFKHVVVWGANHFAQRLPVGKTLVWIKRRPELFGSFLSDCEIGWASGGHGVYAHYFQFPPPVRAVEAGGDPSFPVAVHPTQKPLSLMNFSISFVPADRMILDPYMGSGTTGVACVKLGRSFIGIEIDEGYFDIACDRIRKAYAQPDMLVEVDRPTPPVQEAFEL